MACGAYRDCCLRIQFQRLAGPGDNGSVDKSFRGRTSGHSGRSALLYRFYYVQRNLFEVRLELHDPTWICGRVAGTGADKRTCGSRHKARDRLAKSDMLVL
jgi:hypothetical protein